jgi:hypothetical protein
MILSDSPTKSVAATLSVFWDIARLRRGPQDLPVSRGWLLTTIIGHAALGLALGAMLPPLPSNAGADDHSLALLGLDVAVSLLWGWGILQVVGRSERFLQLMTAIFGVQLVLQPLLVPAFWAAGSIGKESSWAFPAEILAVALSVWALVAIARVLRAATDWPMFGCAVLVIAQGLVTYLIAFAMFPDMAELLKQAQ